MEQQSEVRLRARAKTWIIVGIIALIVTVFGVARRATGSTILSTLTDSEIIGILVGLAVGALVASWWIGRRV